MRIRVITSHMNLRFTSATVTGPLSPPERTAICMYGSVSLRKYTRPYHGFAPVGSRNAGSRERSRRHSPAASIDSRDTCAFSQPSAPM